MIVTLGNTKERPVVNAISLRRELELFMEDTGITKKKVAELLGFPSYKYVTNILEGKEEITLRCAIGRKRLGYRQYKVCFIPLLEF